MVQDIHRPDYRVSIAPMMDWTDRHYRYFMRCISAKTRLYTEMIHAQAILKGDRARLLAFDPFEHPLAFQIGGSVPADLALCARIIEDAGFAEINLNAGCPSERVTEGRFGACLLKEPDLIAQCLEAMQACVNVPVTVKIRIGVDELDTEAHLEHIVKTLVSSGCNVVIVHARKALLKGLSPKENRQIPPLRYDVVHRLKAHFPATTIVMNGGLQSIADLQTQLALVDGVMIGRSAYHDPYLFAQVDRLIFGETAAVPSRMDVLDRFLPYVASQMDSGVRLASMMRHILGLFHGVAGGRVWRRFLTENSQPVSANVQVLQEAKCLMQHYGH